MPDLVTSYAGGNDILRPKVDIDALVRDYDGAIAQLRSTGAEVVLFTAFDLAPLPEMDRRQRRHADLAWGRAHARPWVRRRLSGTSSGDGLQVRRPRLGPLHRVG